MHTSAVQLVSIAVQDHGLHRIGAPNGLPLRAETPRPVRSSIQVCYDGAEKWTNVTIKSAFSV